MSLTRKLSQATVMFLALVCTIVVALASPALATTLSMSLIGQTGDTQVGYPIGIAKAGNRVFTADNGGPNISMIDVSAPQTPTVIDVLDLSSAPFNARSLSVLGDKIAYVGNADRVGVVTGALTNHLAFAGATPTSGAGALPANSGPYAIQTRGNYAYTANRNPAGGNSLSVINISDAANPVQTGITPSSGPGAFPAAVNLFDSACDLVLVGNFAYVVNRENGQVVSVDISDPTNPHVVAASPLAGQQGGPAAGSIFWSISTNGSTLAVTDQGANEIHFFNLGDAAHGVPAQLLSSLSTIGQPTSTSFSGDYLYLSKFDGNAIVGSISLIDCTDPANPAFLISTPAPPTNGTLDDAYPEQVVSQDGLAFFTDSGHGFGMGVVEVQGIVWPTPTPTPDADLAKTGLSDVPAVLIFALLAFSAGVGILLSRRGHVRK